jgi:hypothetical protein
MAFCYYTTQRILVEKLMVTQPVTKFPPEARYHTHKGLQLNPETSIQTLSTAY